MRGLLGGDDSSRVEVGEFIKKSILPIVKAQASNPRGRWQKVQEFKTNLTLCSKC